MTQVNDKAVALALALLLSACGKQHGDSHADALIDFTKLGGETTVFDSSAQAFSLEVPGLSIDDSRSFNRGRALFRDVWVIAPSSTESRDGLGPVFNSRSCEGCHVRDGRGRPPETETAPFTTLLVRLSIPGSTEHGEPRDVPLYGGQLQNFSIPGVPSEGQARVQYTAKTGSFPDGESFELLQPNYSFENLAFGALPADVLSSPRVAPSMIGLGLLEAIPESEILAQEDPDDEDNDGISGRANRVWDYAAGQERLGRFGWKANQPDLLQQTAGAFLGDIGITSSLFKQENCATGQEACLASIDGGSPELLDGILRDVTFYSATLGIPVKREGSDAAHAGQRLFYQLACDTCHRPSWETGTEARSANLSAQIIHPFTDLLLHDMGPELADGRPDFQASGSEWRTPPLWGIGLQQTVNGHQRLLHDGRARNIEEAILWHGGEGQASRDAYMNLSKSDRESLLKFLETL